MSNAQEKLIIYSGAAALSICESLLIELADRKILSDHEVQGLLRMLPRRIATLKARRKSLRPIARSLRLSNACGPDAICHKTDMSAVVVRHQRSIIISMP